MLLHSWIDNCSTHRHLFGCLLLAIVNVLWVIAAEIARYIFVDLNFKRPFLASYIKLCMLLTYFLPYFWRCKVFASNKTPKYGKMAADENEANVDNFLSPAEFEQVAMEEGDLNGTPRRVRFAEWIICTLTYQISLLFTTVSSVNLVSSSSSVFVLILSALFVSSPADRITVAKFSLVLCNLIGVGLVSEYSISVLGVSFALLSAFFYACYLVSVSYYQNAGCNLDINFIFGLIGLLTLVFYSPFLLILHYFSVERIFPLPNQMQLLMLLLNGLVGTVFSDTLWLYATLLTSPVAGAISLSMCIPLSLLADTFLRDQPPTYIQLIAAVPITVSFIGAAFLKTESKLKSDITTVNLEEAESLINKTNDEIYDSNDDGSDAGDENRV